MENVEVIAVIYDTNKPVDPGTGKPPVLADMTIKKVSSYTTKETEESVREDKSVYEKEAELNQVASSQTEIKITETSKTVQKPLWWLYLIGIGVIVAAGWFVYRKMKRG